MTDIEAKLREIIAANVKVGGYPDTMGIARSAYELGCLNAGPVTMTLDRTMWHGSSHEDQTTVLDRWIVDADPLTLDRLLSGDVERSSVDDQLLLDQIWRDSGGHADDGDGATYHWGEGERIRLQRAVARLRPSQIEPDTRQTSLL